MPPRALFLASPSPPTELTPSHLPTNHSIIAALQRLTTLDGIEVSVEEKVAALNCHGADMESRKKACEAALGEGTFVDIAKKVDYESLRDPEELGIDRVKAGLMQFAVAAPAAK